KFPNASLLLTLETSGEGRNNYVRQLSLLASRLRIDSQIVWLGELKRNEIRHVLRCSTLAVFPSLEESFGLPLAEAIVERCPLIASDRPYAREVAGSAAAYFDPLSPQSIASTILSTLENPGMLDELRARADSRAHLFEPEGIARQVVDCF